MDIVNKIIFKRVFELTKGAYKMTSRMFGVWTFEAISLKVLDK